VVLLLGDQTEEQVMQKLLVALVTLLAAASTAHAASISVDVTFPSGRARIFPGPETPSC